MSGVILASVVSLLCGILFGIGLVYYRCTYNNKFYTKFKNDVAELRETR